MTNFPRTSSTGDANLVEPVPQEGALVAGNVLEPLTGATEKGVGSVADANSSDAGLTGQASLQSAAPSTVASTVASTGQPVSGVALGSQWDVATKRTVVVILLAATVAVIWISRQVIPLLVIAAIMAYIFSPVVDILERIRIPRAISTVALFVTLTVSLSILPFLLAPILVAQLVSLSFDVPSTAVQLWTWFGTAITNLPSRIEVAGFEIPIDGLTQQIDTNLRDFTFIPTLAEFLGYIQQLISTATNVMSSTAMIGVSVVGGIFNVLIAVLVVFFLSLYLTKDAPAIREYVESLFPQSYQSEWVDLLRRMGYIWKAFFRGQLLLCVIIGVTTGLALHLAGMPGALVLGLLAAVLEVIPNIGPIIAMIPAVIIALIQGSSVLGEYGVNNFGFALITVAIYFIIQQTEAYVLVPRIIGGNVRLHPVVVVAGVAIGYNVAGIGGAFFAAPVIATCRVLGAYIHAKLLDYPAFVNQPLPLRRRRRPFLYHRTVRGDELGPPKDPLDLPIIPAQPRTQATADGVAANVVIEPTEGRVDSPVDDSVNESANAPIAGAVDGVADGAAHESAARDVASTPKPTLKSNSIATSGPAVGTVPASASASGTAASMGISPRTSSNGPAESVEDEAVQSGAG